MYHGTGRIEYSTRSRVVAWVDEELVRYYRTAIPKAKYVQPQMYPGHITVVRSYPIEIVPNREPWGRHEDRIITFSYNGVILFEDPYYYLEAWSEELNELRTELGMSEFRIRGAKLLDCFHLTLGNVK